MLKSRQSNIEMLRIVAMLFILTVHADGASLGLPEVDSHWGAADWGKTLVESVAVIGVNLFVLISGYFGINLTRRRLLGYLGICAFYSVGLYLLACLVRPASFTWAGTVDAVLFISHNDLWFVREYLFLMLLAPLINGGLTHLDSRGLNLITASVIVISCYFGWIWHCNVNPTGYNLMQMVTIYVCGHWLRRHPVGRFAAIAAYIVSTGCIILTARLLPPLQAYAYNSPFVVLSSMALFSFFRSVKFTSASVNRIARYTFAVYLIHKNPFVWGGVFKPTMIAVYSHYSGLSFWLVASGFVLVFFVGCIAIDALRSAILSFSFRNIKADSRKFS